MTFVAENSNFHKTEHQHISDRSFTYSATSVLNKLSVQSCSFYSSFFHS